MLPPNYKTRQQPAGMIMARALGIIKMESTGAGTGPESGTGSVTVTGQDRTGRDRTCVLAEIVFPGPSMHKK